MSPLPVVYPPPPWSNQDIILYHGTVDEFAAAILSRVRVRLGKPATDFGPGFYTTTVYQQAHTWAVQIAASKPGRLPAVIQIIVPRQELAKLKSLVFVRGDFHADDYWSFVHYCRGGAANHGLPRPVRYYDLVYGPVAPLWNQRMIIANSDQVSFHTTRAERVLNSSQRRRII